MPAKHSLPHLRTTRLFDLSVVTESFVKILDVLTTQSNTTRGGKTLLVATPNPEQVVLSQENKSFQQALQNMNILLPDGIGLVLASRMFAAAGKAVPIVSRVTGVDIVQALLTEATQAGKTVLVVGGRGYEHLGTPAKQFSKDAGRADASAHVMVLEIPAEGGIHTCYWMEGYADAHTPTKEEEQFVEKVIRTLKPTYVFIALGAPVQEHWLVAHAELLQENAVAVGMAVGGAFDMLTGKLDRAPAWMQALHLEWLYRLYQEPWRWRRQLNLLKFIKLTVGELLAE